MPAEKAAVDMTAPYVAGISRAWRPATPVARVLLRAAFGCRRASAQKAGDSLPTMSAFGCASAGAEKAEAVPTRSAEAIRRARIIAVLKSRTEWTKVYLRVSSTRLAFVWIEEGQAVRDVLGARPPPPALQSEGQRVGTIPLCDGLHACDDDDDLVSFTGQAACRALLSCRRKPCG
jgi:hypothetical protein